MVLPGAECLGGMLAIACACFFGLMSLLWVRGIGRSREGHALPPLAQCTMLRLQPASYWV